MVAIYAGWFRCVGDGDNVGLISLWVVFCFKVHDEPPAV